jgi:hypothetical protein
MNWIKRLDAIKNMVYYELNPFKENKILWKTW